MLKIGLIMGREWSFPSALIEEIERRDEGVVAEYVKLGGTRMDEAAEHAVIIDRLSHQVPYYRTFLKHAALHGVTVVNNPFMWSSDDKLFGASLATTLGIPSPRTIALPNREYVPGIKHDESLRNLRYPLDWDEILDYVGLPCLLKDAHGGTGRQAVCRSLTDLIHNYNASGLATMIVQEFIEWDQIVRCLAVGQTDVLPMRYEPRERRYVAADSGELPPELCARVVEDSRTLMRALGYDMCSLDWAVRDGVPYAIDFMNPAPDLELSSLTPGYFQWAVTHMADLAIRLATEARPARDPSRGEFLLGRRE